MNACLRALLFPALCAAGSVGVAGAALAQQGEDRVLVYVADIAADPKLAQDASALTTSLCSALSKDKRLEVLCAPDVKQILSFAATSSMIGAASPAADNLQKRLDATRFVVAGRLTQRDKDTLVLTTAIGPKAEGADASALYTDAPLLQLDEVAQGKSVKLLDKLPEVAKRLVAAAFAPPKPDTTTPPAPLAPTPPTKK